MFLARSLAVKGISNAAALRVAPLCVQRYKRTDPTQVHLIQNQLCNVNVRDPASVAEHKKYVEELLKEELPKPYDGPERDHVNFPHIVRPVYPALVRNGFLPDDWFKFFYKKTGVTGPYVFGAGFLTFILSKEWFIIEQEFSTGCALFFIVYVCIKKFGPTVKEFTENLQKESEDNLEEMKQNAKNQMTQAIESDKKSFWQMEGQKILMNAKRENVHMQLETEYRSRLMNVYNRIKKRLDYHMEYQNTKRKQEQKHMVDWIVSNVVKSITPQQEKEALQKCLDDLKVLSLKA